MPSLSKVELKFPRLRKYIIIRKFLRQFKIGEKDECWEWQGSCNSNSYGIFNWKSYIGAHVVSYRLFVGKIPKRYGRRLCVCHSCDNPSCVNPNHLWLGTQKQNLEDRDKKRRGATQSGEDNSNCKLNDSDIKDIKRKHSTNKYTLTELASMYDVTRCAISYALKNR